MLLNAWVDVVNQSTHLKCQYDDFDRSLCCWSLWQDRGFSDDRIAYKVLCHNLQSTLFCSVSDFSHPNHVCATEAAPLSGGSSSCCLGWSESSCWELSRSVSRSLWQTECVPVQVENTWDTKHHGPVLNTLTLMLDDTPAQGCSLKCWVHSDVSSWKVVNGSHHLSI